MRVKTIPEMRRDVKRLIRNLEQLVRDKEYWNRKRGDKACFDVGAEKVAIKYAKDHLLALDRAEREGGKIDDKACKRMRDVMEKACATYDEGERRGN